MNLAGMSSNSVISESCKQNIMNKIEIYVESDKEIRVLSNLPDMD